MKIINKVYLKLKEYYDFKKEEKAHLQWIRLFDKSYPSRRLGTGWGYISSERKLSNKFIYKYRKKLNWCSVCTHQVLDEYFIEKCMFFSNMFNISKYQKLSKNFISKHASCLPWNILLVHQRHIPLGFFVKHLNCFNWQPLFRPNYHDKMFRALSMLEARQISSYHGLVNSDIL